MCNWNGRTDPFALFAAVALLATTLSVPITAHAQGAYAGPTMTMTMASGTNKNISRGKQLSHFAERVEQLTGGKVKVRVFYDGTLYGERTSIEAVLNSSIDIGTSATRSTRRSQTPCCGWICPTSSTIRLA